MSVGLRVLYGDASTSDRRKVRHALRNTPFRLIEVSTGSQLEDTLQEQDVDIVLTDLNLPGARGLRVLDIVRRVDPYLPVLVLTRRTREAQAMEAVHRGAMDYLLKTAADLRRLPFRLQLAWERARMRREQDALLALLQAREEQFRTYLTHANDFIFTLDAQGRFTFVNQSLCQALGYEERELLGRRALDVVAPEAREQAAELLRRIWSGEPVSAAVLPIQTRSGQRLIVQIRGRTFHKDGQVKETFHIARDITAQVQAQQALRESEERFRALAENATVAIFVYADERFVYVNPATECITGYTAEELLNMPFWMVVHPDHRELVRQRGLARQRGEAVPAHYEIKLLRKDGQVRWIDFSAASITWQGRPAAIGSAVDITEHKRAEAALQVSEARYRALVDNCPYGIAIHQNGRVVFINPAAAQLLGARDPEEILGRPVLDFVHPDDRDRIRERIRRVLESREPAPVMEERFLRLDGSVIKVEVVGVPILFEGQPAIQVIFQDVTHRRRVEEQLRLLALALEHAGDSVVITDRYGNILWHNPAFTHMTGYAPQEALGQNMRLLKSGVHGRDFYQRLWETILSGHVWRSEIINRKKDGSLFHAEQVIAPVHDERGDITHFVSIMRDIEERKRHERQMEAQIAIAEALGETLHRDTLLERILEAALHAVPAAEKGSILLMEEDGSLRIHALVGFAHPERLRDFVFPPGVGLAARVARERRPLLIHDVREEGTWFRWDVSIAQLEEVRNIRSVIAAPLLLGEEVLGVISLDSLVPHAFETHDLQVLQSIASTAALVLQRAQLFEEARRRAAHLEALNAVLTEASQHLSNLDALLEVTLDRLLQVLHLQKGAIWIPSGLSQQGLAVLRHVPRDIGPLTAVYARRRNIPLDKVIVVEDVQKSGPFAQADFFWRAEIRAMLVAPLWAKGRRIGGIAVAASQPRTWRKDEIDLLDALGRQIGLFIERAHLFEDLQRAHQELIQAYDETIKGWGRLLEMRDAETRGHTQRVTELTLRLARAMGLSEEQLVHIRRGALLHDIGKIAIPDAILLKPGPLSSVEWQLMKRHPLFALEMLGDIAYLRPALEIPLYHHERWDGTGYPYGLKGEDIPLAARIFAVVDVYDALTSDRPYRPAWPREKALDYLRDQAGRLFDPKVVRAFLNLIQEEAGDLQRIPG